MEQGPRTGPSAMKTSAATPLVTLHNAGIRRDGKWLVRGVGMGVRRGEIVTLIGPNGAGKSTTAKMALGLLKPDEGRVDRMAGLRVGYVPQHLSVDWALPLKVRRLMELTAPLAADQAKAALARAGVAHLADADMQALSGGELQRVLLARAIAAKPDLLVLDEPVQGVDFSGEMALYDLIASLGDELGCGILLISHDLHLVMAATDTVICLNGHVCCTGSPGAVTQSPAYRDLFGARAANTLAFYRHVHDHTHLADGQVCRDEETGDASPDAIGRRGDLRGKGGDHGSA